MWEISNLHMKLFPTVPSKLAAIISTAYVLSSPWLNAQTTWIGGSGFNWSSAANWSPSSAPGAGITAFLNDTGINRTVVYDASASGSLGGLVLSQTSAFTNGLDIQRNLTIANAVALAAQGGGSSLLNINAVGSNRTVTFTSGLSVNAGGRLNLTFGANAGSTSFQPTVAGNVTLGGGNIFVGPAAGSSTATATFSNDLTVTSGTITVDNNSGTFSKDVRVTVNGNFNATGGSLATTGTAANGWLQLGGASNTLSNFSFSPAYSISLQRNGDQTLSGVPYLNSGVVYLRGSGVKTLSSTVGGTNIRTLQFLNSNNDGSAVALKLGSDLSMSNSAAMISLGSGPASPTAATRLGIDANGFTFDMSSASPTQGAAAGTGGVWKPNVVSNPTFGAVWALTSSAAGGVIRARGFDFSAANVTTTVGAGLTLNATASGVANALGSGAAFESSSTFWYSGTGAATLSSGRNIGTLLVSSGTLQTTGSAFQAAGGIQIDSNAALDFSTTALSAPSLTISIDGPASGFLTAGSYIYAGDLVLNFESSLAAMSTYDLIRFSGALSGDYSNVLLTGAYTGSLSLDNGIWSGVSDGLTFSFDQATGDLSVVPEPRTILMVFVSIAVFGTSRAFRRKGL